MKIISINLGKAQKVEWKGKEFTTAIFKKPINRKVKVNALGLEGDEQADLKVHGGEEKAVYAYVADEYDFWRNEFPNQEISYGMFGENLTVEDWKDAETLTRVGDTFQIGSTILMALQPRLPCFKLGIRFKNPMIIKKFIQARKWGIYFKVVQEGEINVGDPLQLIKKSEYEVSIDDLGLLQTVDKYNVEKIQMALEIPYLSLNLRTYFEDLLSIKEDDDIEKEVSE